MPRAPRESGAMHSNSWREEIPGMSTRPESSGPFTQLLNGFLRRNGILLRMPRHPSRASSERTSIPRHPSCPAWPRFLAGFAALAVCMLASATPQSGPDPIEPPAGWGRGAPIPPPAPPGCLCNCPFGVDPSEWTPAQHWFCGDKCDAIRLGVTLQDLLDHVEDHCFSLVGEDPLVTCTECLEQQLEYSRRQCACTEADADDPFLCDRVSPAGVDCEDLVDFLDGLDPECISRDQFKALICCFLSKIQLPESAGGCETAFTGVDPCADEIPECLAERLREMDPPVPAPPFTRSDIDELVQCYGCDCCVEVGTHGASYFSCNGAIECDQNGDVVVDCEDLLLFLTDAQRRCGAGGANEDQLLDLICAYLAACADCKAAAALIPCIEGRLCRPLTP